MRINDNQNTKIVATVGPASNSKENLLGLIKAGVDIFRLNFSHGTHSEHKEVIERIEAINEEHNINIGILADLQGPKLRIGNIKDGSINLESGDIIEFTNERKEGNKDSVHMSYALFAKDVEVGEKVLVDDGKLVFEVIETDKEKSVKLKTLFGGVLSSNKGVNLPDTNVSLPALTEKDREDLSFILKFSVNWIALSFIRTADEVRELQKIIAENNHGAKVISKIEKPEAVKNIKQIIKASNAIMIARGDLGVEVPIEKVPGIQKNIIRRCIQRARPVIVATQMMESMITNPSPTRAEATDVANAVLDGTDAVMLSAETSVGNHPVKVVEAMNRIIAEAEKTYQKLSKWSKPNNKSATFHSDVICVNAAKTAEDIGAKAIAGLTVSGYTAFKISSFRPNCKIYVFSNRNHILGTMNLLWGVRGMYYDKFSTTDETIEDIIQILKEKKYLKKRDLIVNVASMPIEKQMRTNMLKITTVE